MLFSTCTEKHSSDLVETENSSDSYDPLTSILFTENNHEQPDDDDSQRFVINRPKEACPLDIVFVTFLCCNPLLRRLIINKMSLCRLAIPFIYRKPAQTLTYSCLLWPFRSLLSERLGDHGMKYEDALVDQPNKIVTFLRFGNLSISKSETMNLLLSDKTQNTFYHRNCPMGYSQRSLYNDAVEISWYFPTGRENDAFNETVAFLNIRGDTLENHHHIQTVMRVSNLVIAFIDTRVLQNAGEIQRIMKTIHAENIPVVFALDASSHSNNEFMEIIKSYLKEVTLSLVGKFLKVIRIKSKKNNKSLADILQEFRRNINEFLTPAQAGKSMIDCISIFKECGIESDEDTSPCREINDQTDSIMRNIENILKEEILPLQDIFGQNGH
ncbi:unnamed protein product [Mytilus edulis]|uniref:Up-regulator of cell proliferation-like domain-containing protein n=1 Tax=Mytilus edulis TaxID=6550 RepID=A0A8S3R7Y1_MYTED|nr:unnamed protein product [Mytilus edulis]